MLFSLPDIIGGPSGITAGLCCCLFFITAYPLFCLALVIFGYALLECTGPGLLLISRVLARHWSAHLQATRKLSHLTRDTPEDQDSDDPEQFTTIHAEIGDRVRVRVLVRNTGWMLVPWALLEDLLPLTILKKDARLKVISSIIEPVMIVLLGAMVGFIAISIIAPIYSMVGSVK